MTDRRFPIGPFEAPASVTDEQLAQWLETLASFPARLRQAAAELDPARLDQPYREGGWTRRQVIHHVADSHLNSYVRFKWTLTEPRPTIKAYDEAAWAELPDYGRPVDSSLDQLDVLHSRWVALLRALTPAQWSRSFIHPESGDEVDLRTNAGIYAWHGEHHLAHVLLD